MKSYLKIARIDHWVKNVFVLPGIVFAIVVKGGITVDTHYILRFIFGMLAVCFIASANYIINEWLDAEFDRFHPTKKHRPAVSGNLKAHFVYLEYVIFIIIGVSLSYLVSVAFLITNLVLLLMGVIYNVEPFRTKDKVYLDVLSESVNNALRLLLGWYIIIETTLPPSSLIFGYWMGGAFLMAVKRYAEYKMINDKETAGMYRKSFIYYSENSLLLTSFFYAMCSLFYLGVFMVKYKIELILCVPFWAILFCMYFYIGLQPDSSAQKPEKLYKEFRLILYIVCLCVLTVALMFSDFPFLVPLTQI